MPSVLSSLDSALEMSAAAETSRRRRFAMARRPMLYALRDEQRMRGRRGRQRLCHTGYEAHVKAEDVTFDVIPGRNPDGAAAAGTCQLVRTRVSPSTRNKNYI